jgi:hypothetical protein
LILWTLIEEIKTKLITRSIKTRVGKEKAGRKNTSK